MTIDERLEKLVERHEALAQSVELLVAMQRQNEERFARYDALFVRTDERFGTLVDAMNRLVTVVESHEHRLDRLEGGNQH